MEQRVVIIGAGPAGLTAAIELQKAGVKFITVLEADNIVGGISKTVNYKGNRIDIGGHRFFSKSDWVMEWWAEFLPLEIQENQDKLIFQYQGMRRTSLPSEMALSVSDDNSVMLIRNRLSRIYFNEQFFDYPLKLNFDSVKKLGFGKTCLFGISYAFSKVFPIKPEKSLEDFFINRFGNKLYRQFFKEYTEKVWGVACSDISAEWGAQRVKSLSILKAVVHALKSSLGLGKDKVDQTSLIESFAYPKLGPGQMWEKVAKKFVESGGNLLMENKAVNIDIKNNIVSSVTAKKSDGTSVILDCSHVISTMPISELIKASSNAWSEKTKKIAFNLEYRDFMTVGLLYPKSALTSDLKDNWIYIQEPGVKVGRVQIFNNWSPFLVADENSVWLGLEFFCRENDELWSMSDDALKKLAQFEMQKIKLTSTALANDALVLRVPKAYPGYFGDAYKKFEDLRQELDAVSNLFLIGRNGMHRYNNQDHSMLTAKEATSQIITGAVDKQKIWDINIDDSYHEESSK